MKIRIKGNSIRLRLTRTEIELFRTSEFLEEKTTFLTNDLIYAIVKSKTSDQVSAEFTGNKIMVSVPEKLANEWTDTDRVGIENTITTNDGKKLHLLIEKDFKCLDLVAEDQSDQFENPRKQG